ncbi:MAG TPA: O-antigen ligase family protein [Terracidiphilus sp.]|nr:O-antigen ligase family protein [Terracidiphilus sp.]
MTYPAEGSSNLLEKPHLSRASQLVVAALTGVSVVAALAGGWKLALALIALVAALALIALIAYSISKGDCDRILVGWVLLYPLGYYLLSYPRDRPVIQFDRLLIAVLVGCMMVTPNSRVWLIPKDLKRSAIAWGIFLAATFISFLRTDSILTVGRLIVDGLLLPALLGWYIVRQFRLDRYTKPLHFAICIISIYSACIGVMEVASQTDLLAFPASGDYLAYEPTDPTGFVFLRANGPFVSNTTFAIAGLISFFLLAFLWTLIRDNAGPVWRGLHIVGSSAAILQALLPLFRSVLLTLIAVIIIDLFWTTGFRRVIRLVVLATIPVIVIALAALAPGVFQDRSSSSNVYGRLAQDKQTLKIFIDHPVIGVGLFNFLPVAERSARYQADSFGNDPPVNFPHNNLGWLAVETGLVGIIPYLLSQALLLAAFWHLAKRSERGAKAARYFLFIFLSYWITGFTETAGSYGELNMWFVFAVAVLYRYGYGESPLFPATALSRVV